MNSFFELVRFITIRAIRQKITIIRNKILEGFFVTIETGNYYALWQNNRLCRKIYKDVILIRVRKSDRRKEGWAYNNNNNLLL